MGIVSTLSRMPAETPGVMIASANRGLREQVLHSLPEARGPVQQACGGADALEKLESGEWQVLFLDRRLPDLDAEELMRIIRDKFPGIEVVLLDSDGGHATPRVWAASSQYSRVARRDLTHEYAVSAERQTGAGGKSEANEGLPGMIGRSSCMGTLYRMTRLLAGRMMTVLIVGETGTGKELVARAIHQLSPRASQSFVIVNCAAIPEALLESELFGYARGAFTGATQSQVGRIQSAEGGTLFLDEVGDLPLSLQPKLLRFHDQKEVQRLGSTETVRVNVRVVAATNCELADLARAGKFRKDLFYRLSAFPLRVPALAERMDDIVPLARHFLASTSSKHVPEFTCEAVEALQSHHWEGNVRELQHVMERAAILAEGSPRIGREHLFFGGLPLSPEITRKESAGRIAVSL
ncbi:MAG TPA: sigma-54 dependent transcriptional regulator [Terriglobales bacterium]|nr:sigma-54 dependent transcriptional regulator [Terriglobales bacterium]